MKNLATALSLACLLGTTSFASAEVMHHRVHHHLMARTSMMGGHGIAANGRCDGISYGTGARRCDSATGGPSGGLSSRN